MEWRSVIPGIQLAVRAAVGAAVSVGLANLLGLQYPMYAFLAAVIATDLSPNESRQLGLRRLIATVVGAACGATLSALLPSWPLAIGLGVLLAMLACQIIHAQDGARVAGYICGIVLLDHSASPWSYAFHRLLETALGVGVAWAISYVPKLIRLADAAEQRGLTATSKPPQQR